MHEKLKLFTQERVSWEERSQKAQKSTPLKTLSILPKMVGITKKTAKLLRAKALFYLIKEDKNKVFLRFFFKKPFFYALKLLRSYRKKQSFTKSGDFFFYGIQDEKSFCQEVAHKDALLLLGFSYCHKPHECPSGRFTDACQNDLTSPVCNQCFIGKCSYLARNTKAQILYIPTIHYIGEKIFEAVHNNPNRPVFFVITACEMTLALFGDWGNMVQARGIGVRLDGRICNTMKAFELSEKGIKPGLTVVLNDTQERILQLIQNWNKDVCDETV